jgi:aspartate/methionine/tyrosine aminotransferase
MTRAATPEVSARQWASERAAAVPGSVFTLMNGALEQARAAGLSLIDLSIGSSDQSPPEAALEAVRQATLDPYSNRYPLFSDTAPLRQAAARYMQRRFGVQLDPETQVLPLIGAQEGLAHLLLACTDPGDTLLLPDPCYPPYYGAAAVAGLKVHALPLLQQNHFLPVLEDVPAGLMPRALLLNYPNNPTSAVANLGFFRSAAGWCQSRGTLLIHDHPYAELSYTGPEEAGDVAPSALQVGTDGIVELHSLSKSHHMGGYRVGFAVGDASALSALARVKGAIDFHPWLGIQAAAAAALGTVPAGLEVFRARRDALVPALHGLGWRAEWPQASMYVWARPQQEGRALTDSVDFAVRAARETGVALSPGRAFGEAGEGYVRFALVQPPELLQEAVRRLSRVRF